MNCHLCKGELTDNGYLIEKNRVCSQCYEDECRRQGRTSLHNYEEQHRQKLKLDYSSRHSKRPVTINNPYEI